MVPAISLPINCSRQTTTLLAMPFGVIQLIVILCSSYAAQRYRAKGIALTICMLPALAGLVMIFVEANSTSFTPSVALGGYYLMAFIFGGNPLIVSGSSLQFNQNANGTDQLDRYVPLSNDGSSLLMTSQQHRRSDQEERYHVLVPDCRLRGQHHWYAIRSEGM